MLLEIENLRADVNNKDIKYEKVEEDIKMKLQQLKVLLYLFAYLHSIKKTYLKCLTYIIISSMIILYNIFLNKLQSSLKSYKAEVDRLSQENAELKENLTNLPKSLTSPKVS